MNTSPTAKTILCYGDSNTWGQRSDSKSRFPADVRWTGQLQNLLGTEYYVIEEGLPSRTTNLEHTKPGRNGKTYLQPCLESHIPLDYVIIMLGTNDLKSMYNRPVNEVVDGLQELVDLVQEYSSNNQAGFIRILMISPIHIDASVTLFPVDKYDQRSAEKSKLLANDIARLAERNGIDFLDASTIAKPGEDGLHISKKLHGKLSEHIADYINAKS